MPRHKNPAAKRKKRHQINEDKEAQGPMVFYATSGWRCVTPSQRFVFALLFTVAFCSMAQAKTTQQNRNTGAMVDDHENINDPLTYTTNNTTRVNVHESQAALPLCAASVKIGVHPLVIGCSEAAKRAYEKHPEKYKNDVSSTAQMLEQLRGQDVVRCKLNSILPDERFHFQLVSESDLTPPATMLFSATKNSISLSVPIQNTPDNKRALQQLIHSAFNFNQNIFTRHLAAQHNSYPTYLAWQEAVIEGLLRIEKIEALLKMPELARRKLRKIEIDLLYRFETAAKTYRPYNHVWPRVDNETLIQVGVLDQNDQLNPDRPILTKEYTAYDIKMTVPIHIYEIKDRSLSVRTVIDSTDIRAALYDAIVLLHQILEKNKSSNPVKIADAHLHAAYEPYPALFKLLFPELLEYHTKLTTKKFKECMQQEPSSERLAFK